MTRYLLAHDLGTSGNKATLFSTEGSLIQSVVYPYDTHYFNGTWVEQDAQDWWKAVCESTRELLKKTEIQADAIEAVSFSGQMMGCLCVDKNGIPLRPAIIWADQRATEQSAQIDEKINQYDYYRIVGHRNIASYGIQKFMWIRDHEREIYERTYKILNAKDYIVYCLTGKFCTDYSDANSCGFFDLKRLCWSEQLLEYAKIPIEKLPEIFPSSHIAGGVTDIAARETGLAVGTPVVIGSGDGVAANVGAGSTEPGTAYCCVGTSAWIASTSEEQIFDEKMRTVTWAHMVPGLYAPNGTMQYAGGSYNWLKNTICHMECYLAGQNHCSPYEYMNREAEESKAGSNGVIFLPYLLGERAPRWDMNAKGCFLGLKPENTRGDILRSVLEGVALNLSLILDVLQNNMNIKEITVLGGGAKGRTWCEIMSDVFQTNLLIPDLLEEAGAMGAAVNGGVGVGLYKNYSAIQSFIKIKDKIQPSKENLEIYQETKAKFNEYYNSLKRAFG